MNSYPIKIKRAIYGGILLCSGWLAWEIFWCEQPSLTVPHASAAIRPAPFTSLETSPDALIDRIIILSGLQKQIEDIGGKILQEINQSPHKPEDPAVSKEIEKIVIESFRPEHFHHQLRKALKTTPNQGRLEKLVHTFSAPHMRKITEIEGRELDLEALEAFVESVIRKPLPTNRLRLLQTLESVTYTTLFAVELTMSLNNAMLTGIDNDNDEATIAFDTTRIEQKKELTAKMYPGMILTMAYAYRELDDLELDAYVQFYLTEEGEWFITQVVNALTKAFRAGALQTGKRISELVKAKKSFTKASSLKQKDAKH